MGARFWSYFVPYQEDIRAALEALREQEFRAGRFHQPSEVQPGFIGRLLGRSPSKPQPPRSIREAIKIADASAIGTRSILDMERISDVPASSSVWVVPPDELRRLLGTEQPTREQVEQCEEMIEKIDRGQGIGIVTYKQGKPDGIYFGGYSFD
jgi:sugar/nucleoside kinase (ribokinase family)